MRLKWLAEVGVATTTPTVASAMSLPGLLLAQAAARPTAVALRKKHLGRWKQYTWDDYARRAARVLARAQQA